jgi:hypothetical protein
MSVFRQLLPAVLAFGALQCAAAVTVTYGNPDRFTDAGDRSSDPVKVMQAIEAHLKRLGRDLPPGTDVKIEIHDLDRAGRPRMNLPTEMRVMTGKADPPCVDLSYTVVANGAATPAKRERVCDTAFLRPLPPRASENDPLVYEKRMLEEWFKARFSATPSNK